MGREPRRIACPHCQSPIALISGSKPSDLSCPSCGEAFCVQHDPTQSWEPESLPAIGKFQLLKVVGRGAFGTVYQARDSQLGRVVALKIPRNGTFSSRKEEERFLDEAKSAARLAHPGIVPVFEAGHSGDFPFIVTEFVPGITLADVMTGKRFTVREAAELIAEVARALEHAHRQGVIHRDLKPANVMISPEGKSRLMDFGLAKRDAQEVTMTMDGHVLGTPAYMAPEQARGESHLADARSDIYSLGVMLFELFTAERPFRGNSRMLLHQVLNEDPPSPRRFNHTIPRDLETITLKCLEKDPARRYQTAAALADDLERHLRNEPISARPISHWERAWRWRQRNPTPVKAATAIFLALSVCFVIVLVFWNRERSARASAQQLAQENEQLFKNERQARQEAERAKKEALARFIDARHAVDVSLTSFSEALRYQPGAQDARRAVLEEAARNYERFASQTSHKLDDEVEIERGRAYVRLGDVYRQLGDNAKARAAYEQGGELFQLLMNRTESPTLVRAAKIDASRTNTKLGNLLDDPRLLDSAIQMLRGISRDFERDELLATALTNRAAVRKWEAPDQRQEWIHEAVGILEKYVERKKTDPQLGLWFASAKALEGKLEIQQLNYSRAIEHLSDAASQLRTLAELHPDDPGFPEQLVSVELLTASAAQQLGEQQLTTASYARAFAELELLVAAMPDVQSFRGQLALAHTSYGQWLVDQGLADRARPALELALETFKSFGQAELVPEYGGNQIAQARAACEGALAIALVDLGEHEAAMERFASATILLQRIIDLETIYFADSQVVELNENHERLAVLRSHRGTLLTMLERFEPAAMEFREAIILLENISTTPESKLAIDDELAYVRFHFSRLLRRQQKLEVADEELEQARATWREMIPNDRGMRGLAWSYLHDSRVTAAVANKVIAELRMAEPHVDQSNAATVGILGCLHVRAEEPEKAIEHINQAGKRRGQPNSRELVFRALAHWQLQQPEDAKRDLEAARAWARQHQPQGWELQELLAEATKTIASDDGAKAP